jgi:hypothetical protein
VKVSGWTKWDCDSCKAQALTTSGLPAGWIETTAGRDLTNPDDVRVFHVCSEDCEAVIAFASEEPTPTSFQPVFIPRCIRCGDSNCDGHTEEPL